MTTSQPATWAPRGLTPADHSVLVVVFVCPDCHHAAPLNAYEGPPRCLHPDGTQHWMIPERVR